MPKISNSWVFSARRDLGLTATICVLAYALTGSQTHSLGLLQFAAIPIFFDQAHALMTWFRIFGNRAEFEQRKRLYRNVAIVAAVLAVGISLISVSAMLATWAALGAFHFVRQQYGWLMIATKKNEVVTARELNLNKFFFYGLTVFPILYMLSQGAYHFGWNAPNIQLPAYIAPAVLGAYFLTLAAAVAYEAHRYLRTRRLNLSKYNQYFVTIVGWFAVYYYFKSAAATYAMLVISHGLSYWYINYRLMADRPGAPRLFFGGPVAMIFFYSLFVSFTFFYWNFSGLNQAMAGSWLGDNSLYMLALPATISWTHYILDGFIWTAKKNKGFREHVYGKEADAREAAPAISAAG